MDDREIVAGLRRTNTSPNAPTSLMPISLEECGQTCSRQVIFRQYPAQERGGGMQEQSWNLQCASQGLLSFQSFTVDLTRDNPAFFRELPWCSTRPVTTSPHKGTLRSICPCKFVLNPEGLHGPHTRVHSVDLYHSLTYPAS